MFTREEVINILHEFGQTADSDKARRLLRLGDDD
jgi:hypothetical protein